MNEEEAKDLLRQAFRPGELFQERYRVERVIGEGAFSFVIKGHDILDDHPVAVKVLRPDLVQARREVVDRFDRECQIVRHLEHKNTVRVYDFGVTVESLYYLVMEFVSGQHLDAVIAKRGALAAAHAVKVTRQILGSLAEAHGHQIVHRDMKPENVMISAVGGEKGVAKVLDFGVAKVVVEGRPSQIGAEHQRSTQFIGTPIYMSPEQALGERVGPQTDVYAVGIMLYEMLTGDAQPLRGKNVAMVVRQHLSEEPLQFEEFHQIELPLQRVIRRATARRPEDRYPTSDAFSEDLLNAYAETQEMGAGAKTPAEIRESLRSAGDDLFHDGFDEDSDAEEWSPVPNSPRRPIARREPTTEVPIEPSLAVDIRPAADSSRSDETIGRSVKTSERNRHLIWTAGGLVALSLSFLMASTAFASGSGPVRAVVGLLPLVAAGLWTQFSSVRRSYGGILGRWLQPLSRHMVIVTVALFAFLLIAMPGPAANRVRDDAAWFASDGSALGALAEGIGGLLAALFSFAYRALPW